MVDRHGDLQELRRAAAAGNVQAQASLGTFLLLSGDHAPEGREEGLKWLLEAAQGGDITSMFNLGIACEQGLGRARDLDEAALWFWQASKKGDGGAKGKLGTLMLKGAGFRKDSPVVQAIQSSARDGDPYGQLLFGRLLLDGMGVARDDLRAEEYFLKAAGQGEAGAVFFLGEMMAQGLVMQTSGEQVLAMFFELGKRFISGGDLVKALDCLASMKTLDPGHYLARDLEERIEGANRKRMDPA
ncbi:MAG: sel1 repeat family protein [Proteobacteria bacterium]|nr:sel1 repeat family protein [Pseudomonadota bacterium]